MLFFTQSFAEADIRRMKNILLYLYSTVYCNKQSTLYCMNKKTHWRQKESKKIIPQRNRILIEQRQRIIQTFEDVNEDYLTVAATIEQF